jgi:long-chain-fatty-acid--[acyl-carrier-protein] ligase
MKRLASFFYWFVSKRYEINIKGNNVLEGGGPRLYLPNHQAEIDPVIIMTIIGKHHVASPMISATYYNLPILKSFLKRLGAVSVSDLDQGVRDVSVMDTIRDGAIKAFAEGKSILLYPAGQLSNQGYEKIFNKQSAYSLVQDSTDELKIIAVRINGLWGSMWSRAWIGISPPFISTLLKSVFLFFTNLIFFIPKRKVEVEFIDITKDAKENSKSLSRREFNQYLEELYNVKGEENARFIKHHFLQANSKRTLPKNIKSVVSRNINSIIYTKIPEE